MLVDYVEVHVDVEAQLLVERDRAILEGGGFDLGHFAT